MLKCTKCGSGNTEYQRSRQFKKKGKRYVAGIHQCYDCDEVFEIKYKLPELPLMPEEEKSWVN